MTKRSKRSKRPDPPPSDTPRAGVRHKTAEPGRDGGQRVTNSDVEMAAPATAPATEEPPTMEGPSSSGSGAGQVELARPSVPQSELVGDTLSSEKHDELDQQVRQKSPLWNEDDSEADRADVHLSILKKIVRGYPELDRKYDDGVEASLFLKDNPWLRSVLEECWKKGKYRIMRRLSECLLCDSIVINSACNSEILRPVTPAGAPLVTEASELEGPGESSHSSTLAVCP